MINNKHILLIKFFSQTLLKQHLFLLQYIIYLKAQLYEEIAQEVVNDVLIGYNGTIFAYGVSGSGKSHTMFGNMYNPEQYGIIPRMSNQLFGKIQNQTELDIEYTIKCSMLEIYKENLHDSLNLEVKHELKIKETPQKGIYVQGLSEKIIKNEQELVQIIEYGYSNRQTRATRLNEYSSRSHTIFMVQITQKLINGTKKIGKLNLIDLAGCEKVSKSGAVGEGLEETIKINLSLSCLAKVIYSLTSNQDHIPYRDSKLTRILQESLGGNYKVQQILFKINNNFFKKRLLLLLLVQLIRNFQMIPFHLQSLRLEQKQQKIILKLIQFILKNHQNSKQIL
ncbi:kinesin motor domain protein [Ichthyophthirius multifiliis]|uniref:Kinesin motor domain protein n=1 Tax=Ichthyophthirius multifiliis TaxID=5932 RepID=G0QYT9_ICHMU|nr:kinesin motor domain protein [Ichthyophthirius multifiliis]EGR29614.1 kinesin motor domain protein [Ichthyophthirius multifiliis]|eukprot:XP_004030850.1 kinesin motor domain protein [Ichthyophthirius multifiliis]